MKSRRRFLQNSIGLSAISLSALPNTRFSLAQSGRSETKVTSSTEWRNDEANIDVIRQVNRAYARVPFSREHDDVLDDRPFELDWTTGPNMPMTWKAGVAGVIGNEIALAGGQWNPGAKNLAYVYDIKKQTYSEVSPPPFKVNYTQGACDGKSLYVVSGRAAGRNVARLEHASDGSWQWTSLPSLPESDAAGRWLGRVEVVPGKWLFILAGVPGSRHPDLTKSEEDPPLPNWRLRLNDPKAEWQPMAPYPPAGKLLWLPQSAIARGKLYVFGGTEKDPVIWEIVGRLDKQYKLDRIVPYMGEPYYREAYCYDPETDRWTAIRKVPVRWGGTDSAVLLDRFIVLPGMGDGVHYMSLRVGKSRPPSPSPEFWRGYNDLILAYDVEKDNYFRVGVMLYSVATCPWVTDGKKIYAFGGEPCHFWNNNNTENVVQIATIRMLK